MMLWFVLGGLILLAFLAGLRAFERASVRDIRSLLAWVTALAGLSLALLLVLTGRGGWALTGGLLFGPLLWQKWLELKHGRPMGRPKGGFGAGFGGGFGGGGTPGGRGNAAMSREEAYEVLGLRPGATEQDIRAAHRRLMRGAHPDGGGSDWLASRINQARDVLLAGARKG